MKRVHLALPNYGGLSTATARAVLHAAPDDSGLVVGVAPTESSLLAENHNTHLALVLNAMDAGHPPDYLAYLHSDVGPEDGWLATMVGALEDHELDVLGAVVPIKDGRGLTSTAVGRLPLWENRWHPLRRLTLAEVWALCGTFTAADAGYPGRPLLVNTGCLLLRVGPWLRNVSFTVGDRVVRQPDGRWRAETEPEDWHFSRRCFELGLRVAATRCVRLLHRGVADYPNDHPWGEWQYDQDHVWNEVTNEPVGAAGAGAGRARGGAEV